MSKTKQKGDPERIVKCACGTIMRAKDWSGHWNGCYKASSVPVTEQDVKDLEAYEKRRREQQ